MYIWNMEKIMAKNYAEWQMKEKYLKSLKNNKSVAASETNSISLHSNSSHSILK